MSERGNWSNWCESYLTFLGTMVGLGNVWRFPYLCYKNGGGAFFIPYLVFLFFFGMPLMFLLSTYTQFSNLGAARVWIACPLFKGVGISNVILTSITSVIYNVILSWSLFYIGMSFSAQLPWASCDNEWNTEYCYLRFPQLKTNLTGGVSSDIFIHQNVSTTLKSTTLVQLNGSNNSMFEGHLPYPITTNISEDVLKLSLTGKRTTATEEFWEHRVLQLTDSISKVGHVRWELVLCLLVAWIVVFFIHIKGVKSIGKVIYVTATLPYVLLLVLLIRGLMLPGAAQGIKYFIIPKWEKLLDFSVWADAASQMFYSVGISGGVMETVSSFNKFHNNNYRGTVIVVLSDTFTSVFAGIVVFTFLGFMANHTGLDIDDVVSQGPGIAFMVYPEAVSQLPLPQLWSVLFFLMLFAAGIDSQIVHIHTLEISLTDNYPHMFRNKHTLVILALCVICFLLGIPFVTQGGMYILQVVDWYYATISFFFVGLMQCVGFAWFYGVDQLYKDIELMIGYKPSAVWKIFWLFLSPAGTAVMWIYNLTRQTQVTYGDMKYPHWADGMGWTIATLSLIPVPLVALIVFLRSSGSLKERFQESITPQPEWGPALEEYKDEYKSHLQTHRRNIFPLFIKS